MTSCVTTVFRYAAEFYQKANQDARILLPPWLSVKDKNTTLFGLLLRGENAETNFVTTVPASIANAFRRFFQRGGKFV